MVRYLIFSLVFVIVSVVLLASTLAESLLDIALHDAAKKGSVAEVDGLISAGANVNAADEAKTTALHMAALGGHDTVARRLIFAGARKSTSRMNSASHLFTSRRIAASFQ